MYCYATSYVSLSSRNLQYVPKVWTRDDTTASVVLVLAFGYAALGNAAWRLVDSAEAVLSRMSLEEEQLLESVALALRELALWQEYIRDVQAAHVDTVGAVGMVTEAQDQLLGLMSDPGLSAAAKEAYESFRGEQATSHSRGLSTEHGATVSRNLAGFPKLDVSTPLNDTEPSRRVWQAMSRVICKLFAELQEIFKPVALIQADPEEEAMLQLLVPVMQELHAWLGFLKGVLKVPHVRSADAVQMVSDARDVAWSEAELLMEQDLSNAARVLVEGSKPGPVSRTLSGFPALAIPSCFAEAGAMSVDQKASRLISRLLCTLFLKLREMYSPVIVIQAEPGEESVLEFLAKVMRGLEGWLHWLLQLQRMDFKGLKRARPAVFRRLVEETWQRIRSKMQTWMEPNCTNAAKMVLSDHFRSWEARREHPAPGCGTPVSETLSDFPLLEAPSFLRQSRTALEQVQEAISEEVCAFFLNIRQVCLPAVVIRPLPEEEGLLDYVSQVLQELAAWADQLPRIVRELGVESADPIDAVDMVLQAQQHIWTQMQKAIGHDFSNATKVLLEGCPKRPSGPVPLTLDGFPALVIPRFGEGAATASPPLKLQHAVSQELCELFLKLQDLYKPVSIIQPPPEEEGLLDYVSQVLQELAAWADQLPRIVRELGVESADPIDAVDMVLQAQQHIWTQMQKAIGHDFSNATKVLLEGCPKRPSGPVPLTLDGFPALLIPRFGEGAATASPPLKLQHAVSQELCELFLKLQDLYKPVSIIQPSEAEECLLESAVRALEELACFSTHLQSMLEIARREASRGIRSPETAAVPFNLVLGTQKRIWREMGERGCSNAARVLFAGRGDFMTIQQKQIPGTSTWTTSLSGFPLVIFPLPEQRQKAATLLQQEMNEMMSSCVRSQLGDAVSSLDRLYMQARSRLLTCAGSRGRFCSCCRTLCSRIGLCI